MNFNCTDTKSFLENWNNKELINKEDKTITDKTTGRHVPKKKGL